MTRPSAVPAAGGCSVLVTTITRIPMPTAKAAIISRMNLESSEAYPNAGISSNPEKIEPVITATTCPPMTLLGEAATLLGTTKTVKAVDATATTMATLSTASSTSSMANRDPVARPHWNR
jgi:hypothetical protein